MNRKYWIVVFFAVGVSIGCKLWQVHRATEILHITWREAFILF